MSVRRGRVGDVVPEHASLSDLVEAGYSLRDALVVRAFAFYLASPSRPEARQWANDELTDRELLELVAPHELKAAELL
jgi:hypothetical protein